MSVKLPASLTSPSTLADSFDFNSPPRAIKTLPTRQSPSPGSSPRLSDCPELVEMGNKESTLKGFKGNSIANVASSQELNLPPMIVQGEGDESEVTIDLSFTPSLPAVIPLAADSLFGEIGELVIASLSTTSIFDGLKLSEGLEVGTENEHDCCVDDLDDNLDGFRERGGEMMDRGGNKKKRKIPGVVHGVAGSLEEDRMDDRELGSEKSSLRAIANNDFVSTSDTFPKVPPPNCSKTVEQKLQAALRVLHYRRIHISLCSRALSYRKHQQRLKREKQKYPPITDLPQVVPYFAPAGYSNVIGVVKGATKGSKGLKLARKAEKDREKQNEQMKVALGGASIKLPDFCDPLGHLAIAARALKRAEIKAKASYPTPPSSSDERDSTSSAYSSSVPSQDSFQFISVASNVIKTRWETLQAQLERIILMRAKALQVRNEESENRNRKEAEAVKSLEEARKTSRDGKKSSKGNRPSVTNTSTATPSECSSDCHKHSHPSSPPIGPPQDLYRKPPPKKGRRKRSALANEGNSHHRDNYIPSRVPAVPSSLPTTSTLTSWPASPELIAQCSATPTSLLDFFVKDDDYLCSLCDYQIFFGEKSWLEKAILKKKKAKKGKSKKPSTKKETRE